MTKMKKKHILKIQVQVVNKETYRTLIELKIQMVAFEEIFSN
jgi:hypothetical protein